jgi:hypothetical protein
MDLKTKAQGLMNHKSRSRSEGHCGLTINTSDPYDRHSKTPESVRGAK